MTRPATATKELVSEAAELPGVLSTGADSLSVGEGVTTTEEEEGRLTLELLEAEVIRVVVLARTVLLATALVVTAELVVTLVVVTAELVVVGSGAVERVTVLMP
jgi:hypothetical protein